MAGSAPHLWRLFVGVTAGSTGGTPAVLGVQFVEPLDLRLDRFGVRQVEQQRPDLADEVVGHEVPSGTTRAPPRDR